jgi:hypothetical protein
MDCFLFKTVIKDEWRKGLAKNQSKAWSRLTVMTDNDGRS